MWRTQVRGGLAHLGAVPLLHLELGAAQLVGGLHGVSVGLLVARDHVVQLEAKGHQPAVHICGGERRTEDVVLC